jgi:hypothetical protein
MFWYQQSKPPTWNFSHKKIVPTIVKIINFQVIEAIMWTHMVCTIHGWKCFSGPFQRKWNVKNGHKEISMKNSKEDLGCERTNDSHNDEDQRFFSTWAWVWS